MKTDDPETSFAYLAFVKYGIRPRAFVSMDENEKAAVIAFMNYHVQAEKAEMAKIGKG